MKFDEITTEMKSVMANLVRRHHLSNYQLEPPTDDGIRGQLVSGI